MITATPERAQAAATVPFTAKFSANANGAIISIGNNLLTCPASSACTTAQNGGAQDDNDFNMVNLDADSDATTVNSSSSQLALPDGASVLWAGLYWGARLQAGTNGVAGDAGAIDTMSLRAPGDASYRTITASSATRDQFGPNSSSSNAYQRFADVTSIIRARGNGNYWGGNVAAGTGQDRYAGWALTVVYSAPGLPLRGLTVFDGFNIVNQSNPQSVTVSGFLAPRSGPVDAQLTMVAYEGDLSLTGDYTRLNSTQLATPLSTGSNFFNSSNDLAGTSVTTRTPAHRNMLGFDIKNLGVSGTIANGATSATFTFSSSGDVYFPGMVGLAINLYAPDFTASSKSVVNASGNSSARPGDTLQYTLNYANTGQDAAVGVVSKDPLPPNTTYVPGSLALVNPATGATTPLSDAAGDDRGEVVGRTVTVRLGSGANGTAGGRMACSGSGCTNDGTSRQSYTFQVTLDDDAGGTTVTNLADLDYRTETTGTSATYTANPAATSVLQQADVSITKVLSPANAVAGRAVSASVSVHNNGPNAATDVTVTDPIPSDWTGVTATTPRGSCSIAAATVTCAIGDLANGGTVTLTLSGTVSAGSTAPTLTNVASVSTTAFDPVGANNVSGDSVAVSREADLRVTKTPVPASASPGGRVVWNVTVTNLGPSDAQGVVIDDLIDDPSRATILGIQGSTACTVQGGSAARCTIPTMAAGASVTIPIETGLATGLGQGIAVGNTATVTATTPDPVATNNSAHTTATTSAPSADVRLTKTGPATVVAGGSISWTVVATNWGPSDAAGVTITDSVPSGVSLTSVTTSRGTCAVVAPGAVCDVGTLLSAGLDHNGTPQAGPPTTITLTGTVSPDATGPLTNTARVTSTTPDAAPGNDTAAVTTVSSSSYDLSVSKTANRTTLPGGVPRPVVYTITIANAGPSTARNVAVDDTLPSELTLDSIEGCDAEVTASGFTCTVPGPIAPGGTAVITVNMTALQVLAGGPDVVQTVHISGAGDTDAANNTASWTLSGLPVVDLSLAKTAPATVTPGAGTGIPAGAPIPPVEYDFVIKNNNDPANIAEDIPAIAPVIRDTLPTGVSFVSASVTSGQGQSVACTSTGQDLRCQLTGGSPDIDAGQSVTVAVLVAIAPSVPAGSTVANTASVESGDPVNNPDNNQSNNASTALSTARPIADVAVTAFTVDPVVPGEDSPGTIRHAHITLLNNGPSTATGVTYTATRTVDAFLTDPGTQPSNCQNSGLEVFCTIENGALGSSLLPGQSITIDYDIQVSPSASPGSYPDTVRVATTTPEVTPSNNAAVAPIDVGVTETALTVAKTTFGTVPNRGESASPDDPTLPHPSFVAGRPFTYQIAVSVPATGFADAQDVTLRDVLPPGFTADSATVTNSGTCTITPQTGTGVELSSVECELGTVPGWTGATPAPAVIVTISGMLAEDALILYGGAVFAEQVPNTATVTTSTTLASGATSVEGTALVDIIKVADLQMFKTADAASVIAGGSIGYTLTVVNAGPSRVDHAVVSEQLPSGFTLDTANSDCAPPQSGPGFDENDVQPQLPPGPGVELCRIGVIPAGQAASIHIVADTDPSMAVGDATNIAVVGSLANEADPSKNTATATVAVQRITNIALSSSVSTNTPSAGQEITYSGYLVNDGPSTALNIYGEATFPPGFVPVRYAIPASNCSWNEPPPADPTTVPWRDFQYVLRCDALPQFAATTPGSSATDVVTMYIPGDTPPDAYTATSFIGTETTESTLDDNSVAPVVYVQRTSDVSITKTLVGPDPMVAGEPATWRITVHNAGPSVATNAVISDNVPSGTTYRSATIEGGPACPPAVIEDIGSGDDAAVVRCSVGDLDVGESASMLVTFDVGAHEGGHELCNSALVGSGSLDPLSADNQATACDPVSTAADIGVTLTPSSQSVPSGRQAELTATVRNDGPSQATGVVAVLTPPPGFTNYTIVAITLPLGRQQPTSGALNDPRVAVGTLSPGEEITYRITGTASGPLGAVLPFTWSSTAVEPDALTSNNTADAEVVMLAAEQPTAPPGELAGTGVDVGGTPVAALLLLIAGCCLLAANRYRRRAGRAKD